MSKKALIILAIATISSVTKSMGTISTSSTDEQTTRLIRNFGFDPRNLLEPLTMLHIAAKCNLIPVFNYFHNSSPRQDQSPVVESGPHEGLTPLHFAGIEGNVAVFEFYRKQYPNMPLNPEVQQGPLKGLTPLIYASFNGHIELFDWFKKNAPETINK